VGGLNQVDTNRDGRWKNILRDRIVVDERVYDDEFDDVKTDAGKREVPFDRHGVILATLQRMWAKNKKFRRHSVA
jgi:hypothetical protein